MKLHKLWSIRKSQKGFTIVEIIAVLAITGLIGVGAAIATVQVADQGTRNRDHTTASRHAMNSIYWISRDTQMAQVVELNGVSGFPINMSWVEWDNSTHQVVYSIDGDKLRRSYSRNGSEPSETVIAQYIDQFSENTSCEVTGGVITLKVTATVGDGSRTVSVTKVREICPRPGL